MDMSARNRIFEGTDHVEAHIERAGKGQAVIYSACSPDKDGGNEDAAAIFEVGAEQVVIAVADGLGGLPGGDKASALALRALRDSLNSAKEQGTPLREAILAGFDRANQKVTALGNGSATTLVVLETDGHTVRSYHVGDSGVLAFGGRGKIKMETIAHSPVGYAVEAGVLTAHEAIDHEDRHIVSNVVGDPGMHVGMSSPLRLRPRDTVVLASDGLFDNLHAHEIVEFLRRGPLLKDVIAMTAECNERMKEPREGRPSKPDDVTIVAYRYGAS
jgi:serine/threonine protein phosphatase PrpC